MKRLSLLLALMLPVIMAGAQEKPYKAYVVSNAHFDTQWNWTIQTSIDEYLYNTMVQNFYLFEQFPNYVFNFEGAVKYSWMKEYYPDLYEKVKQYVAQDRWQLSGSTWDANDPNLPSPESFLRNILLGQEFFKQEFGKVSKDIFLPDCFGFGITLPTIASHAGLIGFSTQKLEWRTNPFFPDGKKVPFNFGLWEGLDGSRIMGALNAKGYTKRWNATDDVSNDKEMLQLAQEGPDNTVYRYYGTGDTGGSPTVGSVAALEKSLKGDGPLKIIMAGSDEMYEDYYPFDKHPNLPVYKGELLQDVHATGVYTSQAAMKLFNRRNEQLADAAERAAVVADWFGGLEYPFQTLQEAWKRFIFHQFHDDLTGTSLPEVYQFSWNDEVISQTQFADVLATASAAVSRALNTNVKGTPVMVYNPTGYTRTDVVKAQIPFAQAPKGVAVYAPNGKAVPAQLLSYEEGVATVLFTASVAPVSFNVYDVRPGTPKKASQLKASGNTLENSVYKITLDNNGDIASLYDKRYGKEVVANGKAIRLAVFGDNKSERWPAWEIIKTVMDKEPSPITKNVKISVQENGPLRATLRVERTDGPSTFVQYISLTQGASDDCIIIDNEIDWKSKATLLKAEFPLSFSNPNATYDLGVGYVERCNNEINKYEVPAQQWAGITAADGSYGLSIMNNCKYGWDKPTDNTIRLTLLHTPSTARGYAYQDQQDLGQHRFTYALVGHKGNHIDGQVAAKAEALNQPLLPFVAPKHVGSLGRSYSFVQPSTTQMGLKAVKRAQDGNSYVVRIYELEGKPLDAALNFGGEIESAQELNGVEEVVGKADFSGKKLMVKSTPFQIKTYSVKLKKAPVAVAPVQSQFVELPYNAQAYTVDAFRNAVRFEMRRPAQGGGQSRATQGGTYAAELIPEIITAKGISFKTGEVFDNHIMRCLGDTIALPEGHGATKLYLLAASSDTNRITTFRVDDKSFTVKVPYYSGRYAQWGRYNFCDGYTVDVPLAYIGSHRHLPNKNESHTFTYMYIIDLDIAPGAKYLYLPANYNIAIFAATLANDQNAQVSPAAEFRALPVPTIQVPYDASEPPAIPRNYMRR